jgi:TMEM175 potassium channel family protein
MTERAELGMKRDHRLNRLIAVADAVFAIALTLLAIELRLPDGAGANVDEEVLRRLLVEMWPSLLSYITSFTMIAVIWQAHHRLFLQVTRFDGVLLWLVFLQLGIIAFLPFPTAVVGSHIRNPVAQEFYCGSLLLASLAWLLLRGYATAGGRLVASDLTPKQLRRHIQHSALTPVVLIGLMVLIPVGIGRFINTLFLVYLLALYYVVMSILDWRQNGIQSPPEGHTELRDSAQPLRPLG